MQDTNQEVNKPEEREETVTVPRSFLEELPANRGYVDRSIRETTNQVMKILSELVERHYAKVIKIVNESKEVVEKVAQEVSYFKQHLIELLFGPEATEEAREIVKKFFENLAKGEIKEIVDKQRDTLEQYVNEELTRVEQKVVGIINRAYGKNFKNLEEGLSWVEKRRHKIRLRNKILGGVTATLLLAAFGFAGWTAYDSSQRTAKSVAGAAGNAAKIATKALEETEENRKALEDYKKEILGILKNYETKKEREQEVGEQLSSLEKKATESYNSLFKKFGEVEGIIDGLRNKLEKLETKQNEYAKESISREEYNKGMAQIEDTAEKMEKRLGNYEKFATSYNDLQQKYVALRNELKEIRKLIEEFNSRQNILQVVSQAEEPVEQNAPLPGHEN